MTDNEIIKALEKEHKRLWAKAIKDEAIKEFAERLKEKAYIQKPYGTTQIVDVYQIDNLTKEMTE